MRQGQREGEARNGVLPAPHRGPSLPLAEDTVDRTAGPHGRTQDLAAPSGRTASLSPQGLTARPHRPTARSGRTSRKSAHSPTRSARCQSPRGRGHPSPLRAAAPRRREESLCSPTSATVDSPRTARGTGTSTESLSQISPTNSYTSAGSLPKQLAHIGATAPPQPPKRLAVGAPTSRSRRASPARRRTHSPATAQGIGRTPMDRLGRVHPRDFAPTGHPTNWGADFPGRDALAGRCWPGGCWPGGAGRGLDGSQQAELSLRTTR